MLINWRRYRYDISKRILYILEAIKPFMRLLFILGIAALLWQQQNLNTPILITLATVFVLNAGVFWGVIKHRKYRTLKAFSYGSLLLCLSIFSVLVVTSGGIHSEFFLAFLFYIALIPFFQLGYSSWEQIATGIGIMAVYNVIIFFVGMDGMLSHLLIRNFFMIFLVFVSAVSGRVLANQENRLKRLNKELSTKNYELVDKNQIVKDSLNKIQVLKEKQDGDYFLTSLLIEPLSENSVQSDTVDVDFVIKEKKKFKFRNWEKEIGGDICIAHTIHIYGKPYTLFLNADAMGKSMQGAGGALVLGAIFKSIVERTKSSSVSQKVYPETWLMNAFQEMQGVFSTFDGSMLISLVMGLVDDNTGLMYYVNAEHPWTVIYREGKALFIENELVFRKLGTLGIKQRPFVKLVQLKPGDTIIMGSDGRDDIAVGEDSQGGRIINEDETRFLHIVEESDADLQDIYRIIKSEGDITDDLSLLRICYVPKQGKLPLDKIPEIVYSAKEKAQMAVDSHDYKQAIQILEDDCILENHHPTILKNLTKLLYQTKDYERMAQYAHRYIELEPRDSEAIFLTVMCEKRLANYVKAAELGERLILRDPNKVKYFFNLADSYTYLGNNARAQALLQEAQRLDPDNTKVAELLDLVNDRLREEEAVTG